jgi:hypothetical protein
MASTSQLMGGNELVVRSTTSSAAGVKLVTGSAAAMNEAIASLPRSTAAPVCVAASAAAVAPSCARSSSFIMSSNGVEMQLIELGVHTSTVSVA